MENARHLHFFIVFYRCLCSYNTTCDAEIDNLEKLTEARRQQKRGLMQQLLTGRVRV